MARPHDTDVLIVGAGHAGLAAAYHLRRRGLDVIVIDQRQRVGDVWRDRYDSLRLFTPVDVIELPGMPMRHGFDRFPTKDQVADYQERYARWLGVRVVLGSKVNTAHASEGRVVAEVTEGLITARHLIAATSLFGSPRTPHFARDLARDVLQMHVSGYRRPSEIPSGTVVVVGAGNSGGDVANDLAETHAVVLSYGARRSEPPQWFRSVWAWRVARWRDTWMPRGVPGPFGWPFKPAMFEAADLRRFERKGRRVGRAVGADRD